MTLSASDSESEPYGADGVDLIYDFFITKLLDVDAAFAVGQRVAVEAGSDLLIHSRVREQIAGDLFNGELIEGQIAVERLDHPVAVTPRVRPHPVLFEAVAVGVTRQIEPVPRPLLAVLW